MMQAAGETCENAASSQTISWHKEAVSFFAVETSPGSPKKRRVDLSSLAGTPPLILMRTTQQQQDLPTMQPEPTHFGSDRAGVEARFRAGVSNPEDCGTTTRIKNTDFYEASSDNRGWPLAINITVSEGDDFFKQKSAGSFPAHGAISAPETIRAEEKNPHPKSTLCKSGELSTGKSFATETTTDSSDWHVASVLNAADKEEDAYPKSTPLASLLTAAASLHTQAGEDARYASSAVPTYYCDRWGGAREQEGSEMQDEPLIGEIRDQLKALREEVANPNKHDSSLRNSRCGYILHHMDLIPQLVIKRYDTITGMFTI